MIGRKSPSPPVEARHRYCSRCGCPMSWHPWTAGFDRGTGTRLVRESWMCSVIEADIDSGPPSPGGHDGPSACWGSAWDDDLDRYYRGYIRRAA